MFIACALRHQSSVLWTDDKKLKQQSIIPIIDTSEMVRLSFKSYSYKRKQSQKSNK
ncbi:MAG: hypothetical protein KGY65_07130 [Candidatus Thermoplasmatota archaeon]|nr:hypothetical protein [Candidatus Thermoplasmatota archaeon]